jgi:glycine/D-amino acid oxidase-like deaminating enzyme
VRLGVHFLFNAHAAAVAPTGTTSTQHIFSMQVHQSTSPSHSVQCRSIVIAAGPWAPRVFTTLFPAATIALPMNSTAAAGNHFRLRTPGWKPSDDAKGSVQDFFQPEKTGGKGLDVTSFMGGELYVAGWGAVPEELPVCAGDVEAQPREIADMVQVVKRWLIVDPEEELQVFDVGRCYRPLAQPDNPIIAKLPWELLGMESEHWTGDREEGGGSSIGGLFVHTAHSGDGVTLSLGSGKVMNELLLGHKPSVEISGLSL